MYFDDERVKLKSNMPELFAKVDESKANLIDNLREAVSIASISNDPDHYEDVLKMLKFCAKKLERLGAAAYVIDGNDEEGANLPPVLFANLFIKDEYQTLCVYGNIDTLGPENMESDKSSSFQLKEDHGRLYGCGVSNNKASLICWFNALSIFRKTKNKIPINLKFVIEGTSKHYSPSLHNAIVKEKEFFNNVDYICLTIDQREKDTPCLKYGYRGLCHFSLIISCGEKKVHSGTYGGAFNQPLMDAVNILGTLRDSHGKCIVTNFLKDVKPITEIEEKYRDKRTSMESLKQDIGVTSLRHNKESRLSMHKANLPSLTINSFNVISSKADKDDYATIPNKIEAKFLVRLVVNQTTDKTFVQFKNYIDKQWELLQSKNSYDFKMNISFNPWKEDPTSEHYKAAAAAIETVNT